MWGLLQTNHTLQECYHKCQIHKRSIQIAVVLPTDVTNDLQAKPRLR